MRLKQLPDVTPADHVGAYGNLIHGRKTYSLAGCSGSLTFFSLCICSLVGVAVRSKQECLCSMALLGTFREEWVIDCRS